MPGPPSNKARPPKAQHRKSRSRSRNSSPLSSGTNVTPEPPQFATGLSPYLRTPLNALLVPTESSIEALIERHSSGGGSNNPPSAASLNSLHDGIKSGVLAHVTQRALACDRAMRELSDKRKERIATEREQDERMREDEERRKREARKLNSKKRDRDEMDIDGRPPAVGAHGVARQDGVDIHKTDDTPSSPLKVAKKEAGDSPSASSELSHQLPPAEPVLQYQAFGGDPTQYDDPTIYNIRKITEDMTEEEKKSILCVANYPHNDLRDLTPGTPPDMDYSNAKPTNQVTFSTFMTYIDPFIRALTEEDVAFLKERGDRVDPYLMPERGPMPYREVWAREDGHNPRDPVGDHLPQNEARGSIEDMNDDTATTEDVSSGPLLSRLLSIFRVAPSAFKKEERKDEDETNGDVSMINGEATAGDQEANPFFEDIGDSVKPASYIPDLLGSNAPKPPAPQPRGFATLEQRMLQELRYHGLLTPEATPDYDSHYDDEVAARLRYLQSELRTLSKENGARKARVLELTEERMAVQEYATIADDLDNQINAAYSKRNRTMGKPKKGAAKVRPGQALSGIAISRNTISEGVRMLMERRLQWRDLIGPVVEYGSKGIPKDTVFDKTTMARLMKIEGEVDIEDA